jgi:glycosyltransferase involved in cell wall biosynthesis
VSSARQPRIVYVVTSDTTADVLLRGRLSYLSRSGFDVQVVCGAGERVEAVSAREGVACHPISLEREFSAVRDPKALLSLVRLLRELNPDIVNASTPKAALLGLCAARLAAVPHRVYLLRGLRLETLGPLGRAGMSMAERVCSGLAHEVLCVSESLRATYVAQRLGPAHKCRVLGSGSSNGIDTQRFTRSAELERRATALASELGLTAGAPTLGFVGRPVRDKGIAELASAFRRVRSEHPTAQLLLVGAGFAGDVECSEMIELRRMAGVFVVPSVDDVAPYYCLMNVLVFPSYREGFPNVVLEASCMGLPVVGFDVTGVKDAIVHGQTGQICTPRDATALGTATLAYLRDPGLARSHGQAGADRARREFDRERIWGEVARFYRGLLGLGQPGLADVSGLAS